MVPVESFEPGAVMAAVMNEKCTAIYGTPTATYQVLGRVVMVYDTNLLDRVIPAHRATG